MRILGLDVGTKTLGVAVSDELGWTAQGIETIRIDEENGEYGFDRLRQLIEQYAVEEIVVGFPKNMNGTIGPRGEATKRFAEQVKETFSLPVILWDERLSTMAAERTLIAADVSRKKRKQVIDKMAAVMILQSYLDYKQLR
ncbi:Holliday junction resolvase RuvX [Anoxybacillus suryakundensis]|uniref:Putative pre-16S rRNA nuclease n=1 Tax=Anoxybacillus suryakundensis TaxID=1325335 RepID=A0A0K6GQT7_9BACL|nr:Holliday junction resolvase RuvX [Anoxybacillus suryakundensis]CUA81099.1 RNAse H-fold protein YqgF [Anoxybacillus suryakundensis]